MILMMNKVLFIINTNSGKKSNKIVLFDVLSDLNKAGYKVEVYMTQGINDAYEKVLDMADDSDILLVAGGDGTIHEVCNAMMRREKKIPIGIYPCGTVNDFSYNLNLNKSFFENTAKIVAGKSRLIDIGKFNEEYFDYVAGFGAFCDVPYETSSQDKAIFGNLAYIVKGISNLGNIKPVHVKITTENAVYENDYMFGLVMLGKRAANLNMFTDAIIDDGLFDVLLVEWTPNILELYNYLIGLLNPSVNVKYVTRFKAKTIKFETEDHVKWTLDGENGGNHKFVEIENINKALSIFC